MNDLRQAAATPRTCDRGRFNFYLTFLAQRLSAPDYAEASSLLHAAIDPEHAERRHLEAIQAAREMARDNLATLADADPMVASDCAARTMPNLPDFAKRHFAAVDDCMCFNAEQLASAEAAAMASARSD